MLPIPGARLSGQNGPCILRRGPVESAVARLQGLSDQPMKSAAFDYARPQSLDEACALLAGHEDARVIAGGQTLVPLMAMRLARPRLVVDIARIAELAFVRH